jgi:hypothetical protein
VTGDHFPAGLEVQISINGVVIATAPPPIVEQDGSFHVLISTNSSATAGYYVLVATVTSRSTSLKQTSNRAVDQQSYQLAADAPTRLPPQGAPTAVSVPPSIPALAEFPVVYLPMVRR